jgi:hypothetical protein
MQTAKEVAIEVIGSLPDDCTLDDIAYRLYLRRKLDVRQRTLRNGAFTPKTKPRRLSKIGLRYLDRRSPRRFAGDWELCRRPAMKSLLGDSVWRFMSGRLQLFPHSG